MLRTRAPCQSIRLLTLRVARRFHGAALRAAHETMAERSALRVMAVQTHTPGVGQKLAGKTHERCIYMDYNATTPIFPEVQLTGHFAPALS
jgi:hypothetical protein